MAKMPVLSQPGKEHPDLRIADICCLIVAGEPGCCSTYAATVIGSISSRSRKPGALAPIQKLADGMIVGDHDDPSSEEGRAKRHVYT